MTSGIPLPTGDLLTVGVGRDGRGWRRHGRPVVTPNGDSSAVAASPSAAAVIALCRTHEGSTERNSGEDRDLGLILFGGVDGLVFRAVSLSASCEMPAGCACDASRLKLPAGETCPVPSIDGEMVRCRAGRRQHRTQAPSQAADRAAPYMVARTPRRCVCVADHESRRGEQVSYDNIEFNMHTRGGKTAPARETSVLVNGVQLSRCGRTSAAAENQRRRGVRYNIPALKIR